MTYNIDFTINTPTPPHSEYNGLKFKSIGNTTVSLNNSNSNAPDIKYSLDNGSSWLLWDYTAITLLDRDIICFKGNNSNGFSASSSVYSLFTFDGSGTIEASGNVMSLIDDGACNTIIIPNEYCFFKLFYSCKKLITPPVLPATTLASSCYSNMFYYCTALTTAPKLPAMTVPGSSYRSMFSGCSSLTTAPELPATTIGSYCYADMFSSCRSLTTAPSALPAMTVTYNCYQSMFSGCSSLTKVPDILPATTLKLYCYDNMFWGCHSLTKAPELPAPKLAKYCYNQMFYGCENITYIKCLATSRINENNSTTKWVYEAGSSGTFIKDANASWYRGVNGIPLGWEIVIN